jgi:hypothetical protein
MRMVLIVTCWLLAADPSPEQIKKDMARLEGEWSMVSGEIDGKAMPDAFLKGSRRVSGSARSSRGRRRGRRSPQALAIQGQDRGTSWRSTSTTKTSKASIVEILGMSRAKADQSE